MKSALRFCFVLVSFSAAAAVVPVDVSYVRGFNYTTSLDTSIGPRGHSALWLKYDQRQVDRDLDNARRLNLNSVRVFVAYSAWNSDPALADKNLVAFIRACHQRGIGAMLGLIDQPQSPPDWREGLRQAEIEANILEAAQLVPMREPPTRTIDLLSAGPLNVAVLQVLIRHSIGLLEPYQHACFFDSTHSLIACKG